jgi:hypothetical protein
LAASRDVTVRFLVEVRNNEFSPEPDTANLRLPVRRYRRIRGRVEIRPDDAFPVVAPEDELVPLVTHLCFRAVAILVNERHAVVAYTDSYGYLRLDLEADLVRISGDGVPDVRVPARPLLQGLVACGARFRAWLRSCELEGDLDAIDRGLAEAEGVARRALDAATLQ